MAAAGETERSGDGGRGIDQSLPSSFAVQEALSTLSALFEREEEEASRFKKNTPGAYEYYEHTRTKSAGGKFAMRCSTLPLYGTVDPTSGLSAVSAQSAFLQTFNKKKMQSSAIVVKQPWSTTKPDMSEGKLGDGQVNFPSGSAGT